MRRSLRRLAAGLAIGAASLAVGATPALGDGNHHLDPDQFGIASFTTGSSDLRAGAHPDVTTTFELNSEPVRGADYPFGRARRIEVDMPYGLVGDPTAFPTCSIKRFYSFNPADACPATTRVGVADIQVAGKGLGGWFRNVAIYNLKPGPDEPAFFGIKADLALYTFIRVRVRPDGGLTAIVDDLPLGNPLVASILTLWGVPADHNRSGAPRRPFMSGPTECGTIPTTRIRIWSFEGMSDSAEHSLDDPPHDCDAVPFDPAMTATPTARTAATPTGLNVAIDVPQTTGPDERATAHVNQVQIALPHGMTVSPSSANGLAACSPAEFGYRTDSEVRCPDGSKLGTMSLETPLLREPMTGSVYLAKQNDNPFNSLLALYIVVEGTGVKIKLAGRVDPDAITGRLTTTFRDNPQLPFSRLNLSLKSGSRAPLVNPQTCGTYESETRITAWTGKTVSARTPMTIDQGCVPVAFRPTFEAGTAEPAGGSASTFSLTLARGDHDEELRDITVDMPAGLTGVLADVDLCKEAQAIAGTCGEGARIGTVTTAAGPGEHPFWLPGRAYMTEAYHDAPFGMSFVVPAVAGPFDLGNVVVRAKVFVNAQSTALRVVSDPLPRILQGIPLQIRTVNVAVDKPGFMLNPTSCSVKSIGALISSYAGTSSSASSRFQVGYCDRLPVRPRMSIVVGKRGRTRGGITTPMTATLRQMAGQGNLRNVTVNLPLILNSRLEVVNQRNACTMEQYASERCPMHVGKAVAITPLLRDPVVGRAYLVRNPARRLPDMMVKLKGQGVASKLEIDLVGKITILRDLTLQTRFDTVPDVPVRMFRLSLHAGRRGAIGIVRNLCSKESRRARAKLSFRGQNGRLVQQQPRLKVNGCGGGKAKAKAKSSR